ncbi:Peroxisome biogenesis protein 6 [Linum grandiflorum]
MSQNSLNSESPTKPEWLIFARTSGYPAPSLPVSVCQNFPVWVSHSSGRPSSISSIGVAPESVFQSRIESYTLNLPMVDRRRRKPLVLSSTKVLINSLLLSSSDHDLPSAVTNLASQNSSFHLRAGILRSSPYASDSNLTSVDDSALIGLSLSALKKLAVTSGSLVFVKNLETNVERIAQVVVLDLPNDCPQASNSTVKRVTSSFPPTMVLFPSCVFPSDEILLQDQEIAYISPLLAFNLDLHVSCLKSLVHLGDETLMSLFKSKAVDDSPGEAHVDSLVKVGLHPIAQLPRYASHLRVSFVKIPECGVLESLKGSSLIETGDRQAMIDSALHTYFEVDRHLATSDVFSIQIKWDCHSTFCVPCSQRLQNGNDNTIYFKVVAMEPSDEAFLRVNHARTALVLGGTACSALPPDLLIGLPKSHVPLQAETVKTLASILTPPLCPSALSSKFRVAVLLYGVAGCGKRTVVKFVARRLGLHVVEFSCHNLTASSDRKISSELAQAFKTAQRYSPAILVLRHFDVFRDISHDGSPNDRLGLMSEVASVIREFTEPGAESVGYEDRSNPDLVSSFETYKKKPQVLLLAAAESSEGLPPIVRRCFSHEISMGPLSEEQRAEMFSQLLQSDSELLHQGGLKDTVKDVVSQTSGFMPRDLKALIADAGANLIARANVPVEKDVAEDLNSSCMVQKLHVNNSDISMTRVLEKECLDKALNRSKKRNASALGTPKVPNIKWEDVGGLEDVKKSILDTVQLPLLHKDLFSSGLRKRSGVLLYGPPGTGKTLLAKAVATECSLNFLSVKGPELINMYIGESEKNVRDIFQKARSARPCVIFFDELDSLAPARGASGDSGGVMDRVVSQMLAEIDGLSDSTQDLFIIGASNRPDLIDPALLRPGRFDKLLYVGVNSDASYREGVLKALTRKFTLHEDVSLYSVAKKCPPNFTGADMYALCADAWFQAAKRKLLDLDSDTGEAVDQADSVVVEYEDFMKVVVDLSPSLSMAELKKYEVLREKLEGPSNT